MAEFTMIDKNKYKIVGTLTEEDINRINTFKNRTTLILDNTIGLSSELISNIRSNRVVFSIKGGLDYDTKEKYNPSEKAYYEENGKIIVNLMREDRSLNSKSIIRNKYNIEWICKNQLLVKA